MKELPGPYLSEARRALGTVAKSAAAPAAVGGRRGGVTASAAMELDRRRWQLQRAAQGLLADRTPKENRAGEQISVYVHRVAMCHRGTHGPAPAIYRAPDGARAEYADVLTCGSVWHCPICGVKITSERRRELMAAVAAWTSRGGQVYLATATHSHEKHERPLPEQLALQSRCLSKFKGARGTRELYGRAGVVGAIRALECTHGEMNGWHPHTHELIFARPGERARLVSLRNAWIRRLEKEGLAGLKSGMTRAERAEQLRHLRRHAFTVQDGTYAAEYVAKFGTEPATENGRWGPASELTRGHLKAGQNRLSGRTPFTLLAQYVEGDKRAGMLFRDFALAFSGRRQLYWSAGLRAELVDLCHTTALEVYFREGASTDWAAWESRARAIAKEKSDDEIAAARSAACTEFVVRLDSEDWRAVLRTNHRFDLLIAASLDGEPGVRELLARIRGAPPTHGSDYKQDWRFLDYGRRAAA